MEEFLLLHFQPYFYSPQAYQNALKEIPNLITG